MSLAVVKNLFFYKTVVPKSTSKRSRNGNGTFSHTSSACSQSRKPLLDHENSSLLQNSEDSDRASSSGDETIVDLEAQTCKQKPVKRKQEVKKESRINAAIIRDATIGLSDGLTVPFALTAGLSALGSTRVVIYGGFAELIAGSISMGLGGYLGAMSEAASYVALREETELRVLHDLPGVIAELLEVFEGYGWPQSAMGELEKDLKSMPQLVDFIVNLQHCEKVPESSRPLISGCTIAAGYFMGGLLPLLPYLMVGVHEIEKGLYMSIAVMVVALFMFGYAKSSAVSGTWFGEKDIKKGCSEGVQMVFVGSVAAAAAMGLVKVFNADGGSIGGAIHA